MIVGAADVTLPWPLALLATLAGVLTALGSAVAFLRASSVKTNLELLRGERDDYKAAYEHADIERDKLQHQLEAHQKDCHDKVAKMEERVETLSSVVSGTTAVKELGDLLITVLGAQHVEHLAAIRALGSELRSGQDSILALMGQGVRHGGQRKSDPPNGE